MYVYSMQAPAHFLMGILIYRIVYLLLPTENAILLGILIFTLAFFSHFLIDAISKITYHVPDARPDDRFWLTYHIIIYILTVVFLVIFWIPYWIAMLGSAMVDIIDWIILRGALKKKPIIHPMVDKFRAKFFSWLPNMIEKKWTVINEVIIMGILGLCIYFA